MKNKTLSPKSFRTAIEITETHIKCVQSKWLKGRNVITSCDIKIFDNYTDEQIIKILSGVCRSKKIDPSELMVVVSRQWVILKQMNLPSQNEDEIRKMIPLQLVSRIPFTLEEVVYDYEILHKGGDGYSKILVFVVHKNVSDRYTKIFNEVGIRFSYLTLSSYGLAGWLNFAQDQKLVDQRGGTLILNMDSMRTELCFCSNRQLISSRSVHSGARDLTNVRKMDELVKQVSLSLQSYQKEAVGGAIESVLILSVLPQAQSLKSRIEADIKIPTRILTGYENIFVQRNINIEDLKSRTDTTMAALLGLVVSPLNKYINLTPQEVHASNQAGVNRKRLFKFVGLSFLVVLLVCSILGLKDFQKQRILGGLEQQLAELKKSSQKTQDQIQFVDLIKSRLESRVLFANVVQGLMAAMPAEISLRSLSMDEGRRIAIEGYAKSSSDLNAFQQNLIQSSMFKEVNLEFATKRTMYDMEISDFKVTVNLSNAPKKTKK